MTEPTNPFGDRKGGKGAPVTAAQIYELAESLNRSDFVKSRGWNYYVGTVQVNGETRASLERSEAPSPSMTFRPFQPALTRAELDKLPAHLVDLGLKRGLLEMREGQLHERQL